MLKLIELDKEHFDAVRSGLQEIKENIPYDKIVEHLMLKYEANEEERDIIKDDLNEFLYYAKKNNLIED